MKKTIKIFVGFVVVVGIAFGGVVVVSNATRGEFVAQLQQSPTFTQKEGIYFRVVKFGFIDVVGEFKEFHSQSKVENGNITQLKGEISAVSVDSQSEKRDEIMRSEKLLHTAQNPRIEFEMREFVANAVAQKGEQSGQNTHAIIKGNLTLNGTTKEIQLNTHLESNAKFQNIITLSGQINVKDFGIANFPVVSDFVDIGARIVLD